MKIRCCGALSSLQGNWEDHSVCTSSSPTLGEAVGTWPRGSHSTDWPVTYDLGGIENMSSPIWFSPLGIWFTKLQGLNQLGKGQKQQELPGGREEATRGQNLTLAKLMRKQKLWVNRKLTGRRTGWRTAEQTPGAQSTWWWERMEGATVPREIWALQNSSSPQTLCIHLSHNSGSDELSFLSLCNTRDKMKAEPNKPDSIFQFPTYSTHNLRQVSCIPHCLHSTELHQKGSRLDKWQLLVLSSRFYSRGGWSNA